MNKIGNLIGHKEDPRNYKQDDSVVAHTLVGVEVELENISHRIPNDGDREQLKYWDIIEDGSLRDHGIEFVFTTPLAGKDLVAALSELESFITDNKVKPRLSDRTSDHIHVDVRDLTEKQYLLFNIIYLIFERVLFKYCGNDRDKSLYCVPYYKAQGDLNKMKGLAWDEEERDFRYTLNDCNKYSACNLKATLKYGSIEFRAHSGEWRVEPLLRWINILLMMRNAAIDMDDKFDIDNIPSTISGMGVNTFFRSVFKDKVGILEYLGIENDIYKGIRMAQEIIHCQRMKRILKLLPSTNDRSNDRFFMYMKEKYPKKYEKYIGGDFFKSATTPSSVTKNWVRPQYFIQPGGDLEPVNINQPGADGGRAPPEMHEVIHRRERQMELERVINHLERQILLENHDV